ncbi:MULTISPECIES: hypothetical protein [Bacillales]|uniref:hypothetical protein n=1 Tax=Bacillales TaxID=1385 RepID=UPI00034DF8EA|nr:MULTISPECIES: hypothetical protein [Bacillales]
MQSYQERLDRLEKFLQTNVEATRGSWSELINTPNKRIANRVYQDDYAHKTENELHNEAEYTANLSPEE